MYKVQWCDHEGNLQEEQVETLVDAGKRAAVLVSTYDGVNIKEVKEDV